MLVVVVLLGAALALAPGTGAAATEINETGTLINESGTYVLTQDISTGSEDGLTIAADDVVIDGDGHRIEIDGQHVGIDRTGDHRNVTIRNLEIVGGKKGISLDRITDAVVRNVTIHDVTAGTTSNAIKSDGGSNVAVIDTRIYNTDNGIESSSGTVISGTRVTVGNLSSDGGLFDFEMKDYRIFEASNQFSPSDGNRSLGAYWYASYTTDPAYLDLTLRYDQSDVRNLDEQATSIYRDGTRLSSETDASANTVSATLNKAGTFGAFAPPATFGVDVVDWAGNVTEGENVSVTANLTNPSDTQRTQNVTLSAGGQVRDWKDVTIEAGASENVTFNWTTKSGDAGSYDATVESDEDAGSTSVVVQQPATFSVGELWANDSIVAGQNYTVAANVTNVGDLTGEQTLNLTVNGTQRVTERVELGSGQSQNVTFTWANTSGYDGNYPATVYSEDSSNETSVTIDAPANFTVGELATNSSIVAGQNLTVTANVTNVGDVEGRQTLNLTLNRSVGEVATATETLGAGNSTNVTFTWTNTSVHDGDYRATVYSENSPNATTVAILAPANFSIANLVSNEPVVEGEPLNVTATVENVGDATDTQPVNLSIDGAQTDSHDLELDGGVRENVTLTWWTEGGNASDSDPYDASVTTLDDTASLNATVLNSSNLSVSNVTGPDEPVVEGQPVAVTANVTNVGNDHTEQTINLTIDETEVANTTVELHVDESTNVTLYWNATSGRVGNHTATVASHNENGSTTVRVLDQANFSVGELWTNASIVAGEDLTVTANVTNVGEVTGNQTLNLSVDGENRTAEHLRLNASEHENVTFTWSDTAGFDVDDADAIVYSENGSNATTVSILAPANFSVGELPTNSPVTEGENLTVTANVTNVGDVQGNETVDLAIDGDVTESKSVELADGASTDVVLNWTTSDGDSGTYAATVASPDSSTDTSVTVQTPPDFRVNVTGTSSPVWEAEPLQVTATVRNDGEATDTQTLNLSVNGTVRNATTVTLNDSEQKSISLNWTPPNGTVPSGVSTSLTADVASANHSDAAAVEIRDPQAYRVTVTDANDPVTEGEPLRVNVTVSAKNGTGERQNLTLVVDGAERDRTNVSLTGENATNETLAWETSSGDAGSPQLKVSTEDDRATTNVTVDAAPSGGGGGIVLPPSDGGDDGGGGASASLSVSIDDTNAPVLAGERLTATATVTNDGDAEGTETVALSVDGSTVASRTVTLGPGESTTVELAWGTAESDVGDHQLRVATESDAAIRYVTVEPAGPLALEIRGTSSPIDGGRPLHVHVRATARSAANASVALHDLDGDRVATRNVTLANGESTNVTLTWLTRPGDAGSGSVSVRSGPSVASAQVEVRQPPSFSVDIDRMRGRAIAGEGQPVAVTVRSDAASRRTGSLSLQVDGRELAHRRVTLDGGASDSYRLEWTPSASEVGERTVRVQAGAGHDARPVTVRERSGLADFAPTWATSSVDYRPTPRDAHVGGFLWLTGLLSAAGGYLLLSRRGLDARFLGVALLAAGVRTSTDVVHASVEAVTTEPLLLLNVVLELNVGLLLLGFAAAYAGEIERVRSARGAVLAAASVAGSAAAATNGVHGLTFANVAQTQGAFTYVSADLGPVGWVLLGVTVLSLVGSAALLVRAFLSGADPAWRPVGVLAAGLALAVVLLGASVAEAGPVPGYDYGGAAVGGFLLAATSAAIGHGLHRITRHAQASLIEDLDDPIVICNDARDVVECNPAAVELLPDLEVGEPFASAVGYRPEWPAPGETAESELSAADLLSPAGGARTDGAGLEPGDNRDGEGAPSAVDRTTDSDVPSDASEPRNDATELRNEATQPETDADGFEGDADGPGAGTDSRTRDGPPEPDPGDEDQQFYLAQTSSITADTGGTVGYTVRFTDVTTLKARSVELARKNEQLQRIASTISHDLRNPLTVATGYVEVLRDGVASSAPVHPASLAEQLEPVSESVVRMEAIIDDVIALARGREPVSADERVDFGDVVEDAWSSVKTGRATLFVESDGALTADPQRMRRMLENLFRNAVEHASPDVSVVAGLSEDGFHVADDGPGIPPEDRGDVFEEGYTDAADGTGLGLAIVRQLANAHGWQVRLDPEYESGARFAFTGVDADLDRRPGGDGGGANADRGGADADRN